MRLPFELRALRLDQVVQAHALDPLHDQVRLALGGHAVLEGPDDVRVPQRHADLALGRLVQPREALLELRRLHLVEQLQADGAAELAVVGAEHLRHAPLAGPAAAARTAWRRRCA